LTNKSPSIQRMTRRKMRWHLSAKSFGRSRWSRFRWRRHHWRRWSRSWWRHRFSCFDEMLKELLRKWNRLYAFGKFCRCRLMGLTISDHNMWMITIFFYFLLSMFCILIFNKWEVVKYDYNKQSMTLTVII
jgi:hypothetical protein